MHHVTSCSASMAIVQPRKSVLKIDKALTAVLVGPEEASQPSGRIHAPLYLAVSV